MAEGEECFIPTSKIADTKSRCNESGHVNRFDHRPSPAPFLRDLDNVSIVEEASLFVAFFSMMVSSWY